MNINLETKENTLQIIDNSKNFIILNNNSKINFKLTITNNNTIKMYKATNKYNFKIIIIDNKYIKILQKISNFILIFFNKKYNKNFSIRNLKLSDNDGIINIYNYKIAKYYEKKDNSDDLYNLAYNINIEVLIKKKKILYCYN